MTFQTIWKHSEIKGFRAIKESGKWTVHTIELSVEGGLVIKKFTDYRAKDLTAR